MKKLIYIILLIATIAGYSQKTEYINYKVKDMGYISIPNNMEIQSGLYKKIAESIHLSIGTVTYETLKNRVVFQQKGVNEGEGSGTYARIILKTYLDNIGDHPKINSNNKLSVKELYDFGESFKNQMSQQSVIKVISFYDVENVKLNDKYNGIKISYIRQIKDNPLVYVELYEINNNDKLHEITFSYRDKDRNTWFPIYKKILESLIIN